MTLVLIDPGHGGATSGTRGVDGTLEKHVTLALARSVSDHLAPRVQVRLTRETDTDLSLDERARLVRRSGARVVLSLHANAGPPSRSGAETWVHPRASAGSRALASAVGARLARVGGVDRGTMAADMHLLRPEVLPRGASGCLVEVEYLTSRAGERRLRDHGEIDRMGRAIAAAVLEHLDERGRYGDGEVDDGESEEGRRLRAAVLATLEEFAGAVEGGADGRFARFKDPATLDSIRKSYAHGGTTYTTCIDFMLYVKGQAEAQTGLTLKTVNANLADYKKGPAMKQALGDAWVQASPDMERRPKAGDIILLTFAKNVPHPDHPDPKDPKHIKFYKGSFSHMGYLVETPTRGDGEAPEQWVTVDGGQGLAGKYSVSYANEDDRKNNKNPIYTLKQKGQEAIKRVERWYHPKANLISGEANQDSEARTLLGWVDLGKIAVPDNTQEEVYGRGEPQRRPRR